jgi:hypothetical protein
MSVYMSPEAREVFRLRAAELRKLAESDVPLAETARAEIARRKANRQRKRAA